MVLVAKVLAARFHPTVAEAAAGQELPMRDVRLQILRLGVISRAVVLETLAAVLALLGVRVLETALTEQAPHRLVLAAVVEVAHFLVEALWLLLVGVVVVVDEVV